MIKCVAIDDEPLARECIANYTHEVDFLQLVGTGSNTMELTKLLDGNDVDLVFLDVQMPVMNGIDYLKVTQNSPMVVLTTAYPSYALEGFQLDVLDYLLKPITFNRFFKAACKAKDYHQLQCMAEETRPVSEEENSFFIKCDGKFEKIYFDDILFIQALQNYVTIHTTERKYITLLNMKSVQQNLNEQHFMRVHKSFIVSIPKIDSMENHEVVISSHRIPISRNFRKEVMDRVMGNKLWKS